MTAPEKPRAAFLTLAQPHLAETHKVRDYIAKLGCVGIDLDEHGDVSLTLYSEEQARALIEAAGKAAAMFAAAKMRADADAAFTRPQPATDVPRHVECTIGAQPGVIRNPAGLIEHLRTVTS